MTIRPVLRPDHDAAELRGLMDRFAEATTTPVKKQGSESTEPGVAESVDPVEQLRADIARFAQ